MTNKSIEEISKEFDRMNAQDEHNINCRMIFITGVAFALILLIIMFQ